MCHEILHNIIKAMSVRNVFGLKIEIRGITCLILCTVQLKIHSKSLKFLCAKTLGLYVCMLQFEPFNENWCFAERLFLLGEQIISLVVVVVEQIISLIVFSSSVFLMDLTAHHIDLSVQTLLVSMMNRMCWISSSLNQTVFWNTNELLFNSHCSPLRIWQGNLLSQLFGLCYGNYTGSSTYIIFLYSFLSSYLY